MHHQLPIQRRLCLCSKSGLKFWEFGELEQFLWMSFSRTQGRRHFPHMSCLETQIPISHKSSGGAFLKVARVSSDLAKINAAALIKRKGDMCEPCRIALGAVAPTSLRVKRAEQTLNGKRFDGELVEEAARIVLEDVMPITDVCSTAEYRMEVSRWLTENVLKNAWERSMGVRG